MQKRVLAGGAVGQFIEFYDFSLYGLSALILATHFFPSGSTFTAMLATFATFGVAFLIRPLGGLFFGALGDRITLELNAVRDGLESWQPQVRAADRGGYGLRWGQYWGGV